MMVEQVPMELLYCRVAKLAANARHPSRSWLVSAIGAREELQELASLSYRALLMDDRPVLEELVRQAEDLVKDTSML